MRGRERAGGGNGLVLKSRLPGAAAGAGVAGIAERKIALQAAMLFCF